MSRVPKRELTAPKQRRAVTRRDQPRYTGQRQDDLPLGLLVSVSQRVVIFGVNHNPRYPDAEDVPFTVLVNPKLVMLTRQVEEDWEGCLSVPGMRGIVPRYTKLRYTGFDIDGNPIDRVAEGFHARVVQHECEHLDGILYPQRITDFTKFGFIEELFPGEEIRDE